MRIAGTSAVLLGALLSAPFQASAAPCPDGKCSLKSLSLRVASPVVPIVEPHPVAPKPIGPDAPVGPEPPLVPKPVEPGAPDAPAAPEPLKPAEPAPPKPAEPAPVKPAEPAAPACKRAGVCFADPKTEQSRTRGAAQQKLLDDKIAADPMPADRVPKGPLTDFYEGQNKEKKESYWEDYQNFWENIPNAPKDFENWEFSSIVPKGQKDAMPILEMYASPKEHAMSIPWSFNRDNDPIKELKWTDMVKSNWEDASAKANPPVDPKELRFMAKDNIVRDGDLPEGRIDAQDAIDTAWEKMGKPESMMTLKRASAEDSDERAAYELIADTTHGNRAIQFAIDNQKTYGLNVKAFHVFRPGMKDGPAPKSAPSTPGSDAPPVDPNAPPHDPKAGTQYAIIIEYEPAVKPAAPGTAS